ncbi:MAG: flavodoxin-dependent (E)-4-hydroxy-3-methylbut-2-enyl-diphosphate synthase [Deltaproteobacteria bacterium]|nr:flavodoxin-dependent (E)-4-hydroxy-3-methylbut-2-enyl-diphosphate synthase [Deltaproteobacteria bacterium]
MLRYGETVELPRRRKTRPVHVGAVVVGGDAPISVQSMTKTDTRDVEATIGQIQALKKAGCEIVRVAVPDEDAAEKILSIRQKCPLPLVADIHFDHRLALKALEGGADGLRINPGNIGSPSRVEEVVRAAKDWGTPIRIGVNAGSLEKDLLERHGGATPEAMVESALGHVAILERLCFDQIKISLKASDVARTVRAYRILAERVDYPLHVGITEAGPGTSGVVKSSVGLGILLSEGIGDTLRVSLTDDPTEEVRVGWKILSALGIRQRAVNVVSCPTCGRCEGDLLSLAMEVEQALEGVHAPLTVAVMGCPVNGPGEAREADVGVACGSGRAMLFKRGKKIRTIRTGEIVESLVKEVRTEARNLRDASFKHPCPPGRDKT